MPFVEIDPENPADVLIHTNYVDRFLIKQLPGSSYRTEDRLWRAPLSWATCVILRGLFKHELQLGEELVSWARRERRDRVDEANRLRLKLQLDDDDHSPVAEVIRSWRGTTPFPLRPFQEAGVRYLYAAISAGLTDPMGSGKTVQGIMLLRALHELNEGPFPALIVAPKTVVSVWLKEFRLWWPEAVVQPVSGGAGERAKQIKTAADVHVINWDALRHHSALAGYGSYSLRGCVECDPELKESYETAERALATAKQTLSEMESLLEFNEEEPAEDVDVEQLKKEIEEFKTTTLSRNEKLFRDVKRSTAHSTCERCARDLNDIAWRTIIADEAHRAKDPRSKQTRALWKVSRLATRRNWMTGTPIANKIDDLWSPLHFMDPREWPAKTKYIDYFANSTFNFFGGMEVLGLKAETRDQFFAIADPRMRRMPKELILPQLPPKVYSQRDIEMTPKQKRAYDQLVKEKLAEIQTQADLEAMLVGANPLVRNMRLMQLASSFLEPSGNGWVLMEPSSKVDFMEEVLEDMEGDPLVVFAMSRQLIELAAARLEKKKIDYRLITGSITQRQRDSNIEDFQAGRIPVMLATMGAGGVGITLTAAHTMLRLQRDWSAVNNSQAEDRIHRIGSEVHQKVTIIDAVAPETVEVHQLDVLAGKAQNLQEVVRDKQQLAAILRGQEIN